MQQQELLDRIEKLEARLLEVEREFKVQVDLRDQDLTLGALVKGLLWWLKPLVARSEHTSPHLKED
ncbi:hypothetical protein GPECTOR_585g646 [Gonium pectorale]|uniref:Uncharacterized protein n=1 Tax=Gonium pectorale TaxID=33097 RepID=A0A150FUL1_GONPE|nr:hypothetical protein GPECTOR_585g646 [Gonium pectorale]|eukprot:KXZ41276.1 hypothetical protein GPECTOR_585g646 [Gonium pectorale]